MGNLQRRLRLEMEERQKYMNNKRRRGIMVKLKKPFGTSDKMVKKDLFVREVTNFSFVTHYYPITYFG